MSGFKSKLAQARARGEIQPPSNLLDREQFKEFMLLALGEDIAHDNGILWTPEHKLADKKCAWFVMVKPFIWWNTDAADSERAVSERRAYWAWCDTNLRGELKCFYCDTLNEQEWWGFTEYNDLALWLLRWT